MSISKMNSVTLSEPVTIDGNAVTQIDLRKPRAGEMRGMTLTDILRMDAMTMIKLLPRISTPPLNETQVANMDAADFTELATKTVLFFMPKEQLEGQMLELQTV